MAENHSPETILQEALEFSDLQARAAYLDEVCGENEALRGEIESLLAAHFAADAAFMDTLADPVWQEEPTEKEGDRIGRYKLLQQIGEGGFGTVYMAEQTEPVKRRVALKVIKAGMDSKEVIARFEAERQALALMDHPNIAKVHDAGATEGGRPYFVMELVKGIPLTKYCTDKDLDTKERLDLFIDVCAAVQHAHQKGIIHRDLKPSNILVSPHDGKPVVKVIDFGIAKAISMELTEKTLFTVMGRMIGTPQYMSPEQAELNALDVDTRSDIYSLGVVLYELLTETTPLDGEQLRSAAYGEMQRLIREETPVKPSTRVSTARQTSHSTQTSHAPDHRTLRRDLDWIVMKALEKDRARRYETANAFAMDVRRYLDQEPVTAGPPGVGYKMGKFVQRNRIAVAVAATITLLLVAGVFGTLRWYAIRAAENLEISQRAEQRARAAKERAIERQRETNAERAMLAMLAKELVAQAKLIEHRKVEPDGSVTIWHSNGQKWRDGNLKDGKEHGPVSIWYENGRKSVECNFKDGKLAGLATVWDRTGKNIAKFLYLDGNMNGDALRGFDFFKTDWSSGQTKFGSASLPTGAAVPRHARKSSRTATARDPESLIYPGPAGLAGWLQPHSPRANNSDPPWLFEDGKLVSRRGGGIAREIAAPPRSKLSFRLAWSKSLWLQILISSDQGDTRRLKNTYDLVMKRRFVYLGKRWRHNDSGGSRIVGQTNLAVLAENEEAFFEIYLDHESGLIALYLNGERVHAWIDADPAIGDFGDWLHFISKDSYPVEISQLKVESWNGFFPDGASWEDLIEEQEVRKQWVQTLKPVAPWPPEVEYRAAAAQIDLLRQQLARSKRVSDEVANEAVQSLADARNRYKQAMEALPTAEADPQHHGHVINPYTDQPLDRRGVRSGTRIRDPNDPKGERTFRVPSKAKDAE